MAKYSLEFKLKIVQEHLEEKIKLRTYFLNF